MKDPDRVFTDLDECRRELLRERAARKEAERIAEEASLAHAELLDGLEAAKEEVLEAKREILRLSNPVLPIWSKVLLMPVIGRVDGERASVLLQSILDETARTGASVVILDVSAVPTFGRDTGLLLQQFHDALALVGARMVLCGVRPAVARNAAEDVDDAMGTFGRIPTRRRLSDALAWALDNLDDG